MKIKYYIIALLFINTSGFAQLIDDFSDGNFTSNPSWSGNTSDFIVNNAGELQLNAAAAGISKLYTQVALGDSNVWEFYVKLDFAPSASNGVRIYLQSSGSDLTNTQGYYLEVGETGSTDAFILYRQDGTVKTMLKKATLGTLGGTSNLANVKVIRNAQSEWTLYADYTGGTNFSTEFSVIDGTYKAVNGYFGLYSFFTLSNKSAYYFDNIKIRKLEPDVTPPKITSVATINSNSLRVLFDEPISSIEGLIKNNYLVDRGIGNPSTVVVNPDSKGVVLTFATNFVSGENYSITVSNMTDTKGNRSLGEIKPFSYLDIGIADGFDILINEIMADPTPVIGLPDAEYIEIYNRSSKNLDLSQIKLKDATKTVSLPGYIMKSGQYLILCAPDKRALLSPFGECLPISDFLSLTNSGKEIMLIDNFDKIIHIVTYSDTWYPTTAKKEGGWSLELINPDSPCKGDANWTASTNLKGGTPGKVNSVLANIPDPIGLQILSIYPLDANNIEIVFDRSIRSLLASDIDFSPAIAISNFTLDQTGTIAILELSTSLQANVVYNTTFKTSIKDCTGAGAVQSQVVKFGLPSEPVAKDLVINEILTNPYSGGYDFVEIWNRSNKIIDMSKLNIGNVQPGNEDIKSISIKKLILPGDYAVFTENANHILLNYTVKNPQFLYETDLPTWDDKADNITLYTTTFLQSIILDSVNYTEDWHYALLKDKNGVSLERINPQAPSQQADNWHSAASAVGFATPTYQNSQFRETKNSSGQFSFSEKTISPNEDGYKDFLLITYKDIAQGTKCTISIYDAAGAKVLDLVKGELLGAEGQFKWDGTIDQNAKARSGIYIFNIEYFNTDGKVSCQKETCVVGYPKG